MAAVSKGRGIALETFPTNVRVLEPAIGALSGKGAILRAQGRMAEALSAMKESLALDPFVPGLKAAVEELEKTNPEL